MHGVHCTSYLLLPSLLVIALVLCEDVLFSRDNYNHHQTKESALDEASMMVIIAARRVRFTFSIFMALHHQHGYDDNVANERVLFLSLTLYHYDDIRLCDSFWVRLTFVSKYAPTVCV